MKEKYYIPAIEEFRPGFEYEITSGYEWVKKTFSKKDLKSFLYENLENGINQGYIRVKYLDKEDIESLGFEVFGKGNNTFQIKKDTSYLLHLSTNKVYIYKDIEKPRKSDATITIFEGKIKNKSELKILLQQLEIIN